MKSLVKKLGNYYTKKICEREYRSQKPASINERPIEFGFVFKELTKFWPNTILDVGTGMTALPHLMRNCGFVVTAIDNIKDYWSVGMVNRHYHIVDDDITNTKLKDKFDLVTCISTLEHIQQFDRAVTSMFSLLNEGGHLLMSFPYHEKKYVENVYALPGSIGKDKYPFVTQVYSRRELDSWLTQNGGKILDQEYWQFVSGEFWTLGNRIIPPRKVDRSEKHQLTCVSIQKT